jgi:hypothetical protein
MLVQWEARGNSCPPLKAQENKNDPSRLLGLLSMPTINRCHSGSRTYSRFSK